MENCYYVYHHINTDTNEVFYVGKGKDDRMLSSKRNKLWDEYVSNNKNWKAVKVYDGLTENEAFNIEILEIEKYGRIGHGGILCNILVGGPGFNGNYDDTESKIKKQIIEMSSELFNKHINSDKLTDFYLYDKSILNSCLDFIKLSKNEQDDIILKDMNEYIKNLKKYNIHLKSLNEYKGISDFDQEILEKIRKIKSGKKTR